MSAALLASALLTWSGLVVLCRRSEQPRRAVGLAPLGRRKSRACALAGCASLVAAAASAVAADGPAFGLVLWIGLTGVLGLLLAGLLPFAGMRVLRTGGPAFIAGLILALPAGVI